jgi:hypothetical protein
MKQQKIDARAASNLYDRLFAMQVERFDGLPTVCHFS